MKMNKSEIRAGRRTHSPAFYFCRKSGRLSPILGSGLVFLVILVLNINRTNWPRKQMMFSIFWPF